MLKSCNFGGVFHPKKTTFYKRLKKNFEWILKKKNKKPSEDFLIVQYQFTNACNWVKVMNINSGGVETGPLLNVYLYIKRYIS